MSTFDAIRARCEVDMTREDYDALSIPEIAQIRLDCKWVLLVVDNWRARAEAMERALRIYGSCRACAHSDGLGLHCDIGGRCDGKHWEIDGIWFTKDDDGRV